MSATKWDALQCAIKATIKSYERAREEYVTNYERARDADNIGLLSAYDKGNADAYARVIDDLKRWCV